MATNINTILEWFKTGKKPTQQQFWDSWQSFWHKDEIIPQTKVENLSQDIDSKTSNDDFLAHISNPEAHSEMRELLQQESYKVIDALISDAVYNVSADDFGKTLRYNGTTPITIVLSTTVPFTIGKRFKIYQAGSGQVTFSVNGYILRHGSDVLPKLYGAYSNAAVEVTDSSPAQVYIYGKLELA